LGHLWPRTAFLSPLDAAHDVRNLLRNRNSTGPDVANPKNHEKVMKISATAFIHGH
jgi:hypothetical protein